MASGRGADRVTLLHELVASRGRESAGSVAHLDGALEHGEVRARRDDGALGQKNSETRREQEERCGERADENEWTARAARLRDVRHRDQRHGHRRVRAAQRLAHISERRGDNLELDPTEHVLCLVRRRVVERVGHRERRARPTKLREDDRAQLAEAPRKLSHDGGLGRLRERHDRATADAREHRRERLFADETRPEERVR